MKDPLLQGSGAWFLSLPLTSPKYETVILLMTILWENPDTLENARNQLSEMIARDKNRAAVVIWSVANETPLSDARLSFLVLIEVAGAFGPALTMARLRETDAADPLCCAETDVQEHKQSSTNKRTFSKKR